MENIENVKKLVSALKSINQDIERKPKCFMTPMQLEATEETLYKISGIKVKTNSIGEFKELEEYYREKYLSKNVPKLEELEEKKPEEGDYCKRKIVKIIKYEGEIWPCSNCDVRCPHSYKKEEIDFLVKKIFSKK